MAAKKTTPREKRNAARVALLNEQLALRPLQSEDLTAAERRRADTKRKEVALAAPAKAVSETNDVRVRQALLDTTPKAESRNAVVNRIADEVQHPDPKLRLPGEAAVPDADWYPRVHATPIRRISQYYGVNPEAGAVSSGSMSPQNGPTQERAAFAAIAKAQKDNAVSEITEGVQQMMPAGSPIRDIEVPPTGSGENPAVRVKFRDMSPEQIRDLTAKDVRDSGVLTTDIDSRIGKAGTNKVAGVRGVRGASSVELNPPATAPKVSTYTQHGFTFGEPHTEADHAADEISRFVPETEEGANSGRGKYIPLPSGSDPRLEDPNPSPYGGPEDNSTAQEIRFRAKHAAEAMPGQLALDVFNTHDDRFTITKELHDHLTASGAPVRGTDIGRVVRMRELPSATVPALSHPAVKDVHEDGSRISQLAKLSSQLPPVIDSWANGDVHGYPDVTMKPTGSGSAGYWGQKTLSDGTHILDSRNAVVNETALQHAEYGGIFRDSAHTIANRMRFSPVRASTPQPPVDPADDADYPSTAVQSAAWIRGRRGAGADAPFNQAVEAMTKERNAAHAEALRVPKTMLIPPRGSGFAEGPWQEAKISQPALPKMSDSKQFKTVVHPQAPWVPLPEGDPHIRPEQGTEPKRKRTRKSR